ncbi:MAG: ribonuclease Z [Candidatus Lokiarchaeota archaeon]|nr:ribonuclease Z [Candidatus Lokiarchaeota archaeon]MBD3200340.1 ribonuclease Z [Candidatus Lokiarchaeota archaeon]
MELIILGSSAAIPVKNRNLSAIALRYRGETILFDCGEDLQRRFIEAGLKFNKPLQIFISHFHGDHIIGLPGLLFRFSLSERTAPLTIFGQRNLHAYLYFHNKILGLKANYPLTIYEIDHQNQNLVEYKGLDAETPSNRIKIENSILFEKNRYIIRYTQVKHSVNTFAYSFEEKPRFGKFHPERARELGIPESRLWKKLQSGKKLEYNGRIVDPLKEGIVDPQRPGRKITYSGDTMPCKSLIDLGMNSDVIIHESTFLDKLRDVAHEKQHSTSVDAAKDAKKMNAKILILTHISSRYQEDAEKLLEEAKEIFPNTEIAEDLKRFKIK